jgi:heat shock protein HtpX
LFLITIITNLLGVDRWLTAQGINYTMLLIFSAVVGFAGSFISLAISKWMAIHAFNIRLIKQPSNQTEEWLVEKVREQTQRARIGMPDVGIYESPEVNAFATGASRNHALVAVSTGLLRQMERREVEGVLAHEVSHITNGDMVTMTLLQGVLNTFVVFLSRVVGFAVDQFMRRGESNRGGIGIGYYLGSMVCQIVLGLLATLIVMAYSRRREFKADAMAARLEGKDTMIAALRRLKQVTQQGAVIDNRAPSMNAFKINNKVGHFFASHPPLEERIAALERL